MQRCIAGLWVGLDGIRGCSRAPPEGVGEVKIPPSRILPRNVVWLQVEDPNSFEEHQIAGKSLGEATAEGAKAALQQVR
ncbi:hypothetical protein F5Y05DRAFT_414241 [Hypoxylon sp. FL0543]|nr:hypothetical protein F5Y05DRAFT_414241 [Hypoxylon sp. FL0543]